MSCIACQSVKQQEFPAEINIHFPGWKGLDKPTVWLFPRVSVCLDCGFARFTLGGADLRRLLKESDSDSQSFAQPA